MHSDLFNLPLSYFRVLRIPGVYSPCILLSEFKFIQQNVLSKIFYRRKY